ncbi:MAG: hypothetical protein H6551_11110 [Chitinophagales bacterium]|nr:hypothetical protein [Chitinophagaceae bacterium]MCB9065674.1 hypothetical protein [Chitinophagales bacterium]
MKKLLAPMVLLLMISTTSCLFKEYSCICKVDGEVVSTLYVRSPKKDAREACDNSRDYDIRNNGYDPSEINCDFK